MGLDEFSLCLGETFFSGKSVSGFVKLRCGTDLTNINHIQVKVVGFAHVQWNERIKVVLPYGSRFKNQQYRREKTIYYENHVDLLNRKQIIHSGDILEGEHVIPFEAELPADLPCSFEGQYGHIRYYVEAKLDRSGIFTSNKRQRQFITVLSLVDLNRIPGADQTVAISREKEFNTNCCFIDGGYVTVQLSLPRVYYTPGEFLPITSQIENHSDITITKTMAKLIMDVVYHEVSGKTAKTSNTLLARNQGKIKGGRSDGSWYELPLCTQEPGAGCYSKPQWTAVSPIPSLPPSTMAGHNYCNIIECGYRLEFSIFAKGYHHPFIIIGIPLTIGSVPLRKIPPSSLDSKAEEYATPSAPLALPLPADEANGLPPPSYAEAVAIDVLPPKIMPRTSDSKDTHANWDFKPKYPVWPS